jgi:hypothetical protein
MPLTKEYLKSICETTDQYRVRRVIWAIKKLRENETEIKAWRASEVEMLTL